MPPPRRQFPGLPALLLSLIATPLQAAETVTVYAAASLTNALTDIAAVYRKDRDVEVRHSFASTGTLARQVEAGAPAQVFASADKQWMDYLQKRGLINTASRRNLLGNTLVLIAPKRSTLVADMRSSFNLAAAFSGKLCTGDTASVPVGIYAREALMTLGWWAGLEKRIVGTEDVRTALAFVERGECPLGIVYRTDASISSKVQVVGEFPADSHKPVVYPFALLPRADRATEAYFAFLNGDTARDIFRRHGFSVLAR